MTLTLTAGTRLYSALDATEFIVVKAPSDPVDVTIGGVPALLDATGRTGGEPRDGHGGAALLGKRYVDAADSVELLCTKPGPSLPGLGGEVLVLKEAKPLPASD